MDTKKLFALMIVALMGIVPVAAADAKFLVSDVDFDDRVAPGSTVPVTVTLENIDLSKDVEDITVKLWLEDSDGKLVGERYKTHVVQVQQDNEKDVKLSIVIPRSAEEGEYTLYASAEGEWEKGGKVSSEWSGEFEVELEDDSVAITDVQLSTSSATAGDSIDAAVSVLNNGNDDQTNVKVRVSIGDAESSILIPTLAEGEEQIVYMTLQMPKDLDAGIQTIKIQAYNGIVSSTATKDIVVEAVTIQTQTQPTETTFPVQTIANGKASVFGMQIVNNNGAPATYSFALGGLIDWASNTRVDPTSVTLAAGESTVIQVHLIPTASGEHAFALFVKQDGSTIATQIVKVNVEGATAVTEEPSALSGESVGLAIIAAIVLIALAVYYRDNTNGSKKRETLYY